MEKLEEDRLSSLPNVILHCIMSKLPEKDAARTCVLSKAWLDTFPILSFCTSKFMKNKRTRKILGFSGYVKRRILKFRDQGLTIKEFKLKLDCDYISKDVDIWLKLACECGVEVIEYSQDVPLGQDRYHVLPMCVIEAKSITKLVLKGYIKIDPIFMNHSIEFPSLRVLSLESVCVGDEHAMNHLISLCPLIESINLRNLRNLRNLQMNVSSLQKLKRVYAFGIQNISVDSPTIETLWYHCPDDFNSPFKIDFDRCRNLKELWVWSVKGAFFTEMWLFRVSSKFPFLESLKLNNCKTPKRIYFSSVRLKVLELSDCKMTEWIYISSSSVQLRVLKLSNCFNMKEVKINAPNLLSCGYEGVRLKSSAPTISFENKRISSQLEVNILIHADRVGLFNLRKFLLQNIKPNNVLTSLSLSLDVDIDFKVDAADRVALQASSPLPRIKHLNINCKNLTNIKYLFSRVVKILLSSCCPTTISFSNYLDCKEFIEFFYKKMIRRRKVDKCFCTSYDTKCWWHGLKKVKVTRSSMKMNENVDFKNILKSLATSTPQESIIFRLEF